MKKANPKTILLEHSEAKVKLYGRYLSVYLNILHRAGFVKKYSFLTFSAVRGYMKIMRKEAQSLL